MKGEANFKLKIEIKMLKYIYQKKKNSDKNLFEARRRKKYLIKRSQGTYLATATEFIPVRYFCW